MTQRINGFTVAFDKEMRIDDAQTIMDAVALFKHIAAVEPVEQGNDSLVIRMQLERNMKEKLWDTFK